MKSLIAYVFIPIFILFLSSSAYAMTHKNLKKSYHQSYQYEYEKKYTKAIKVLETVRKEYPNSYTVNLRMGWLYYLAEKYELAIQYYSKASKVIPESIEAHQGLANSFDAKGDYSKAKNSLYIIRSIDKNNYRANLLLVRIFKAQEKYSIAEQICIEMLKLYPIDASFLTELALIKNIKGDKKVSKKLFKNIIILDPTNSSAKQYLK